MKSTTIVMFLAIVGLFPVTATAQQCVDDSECQPGQTCQSGECVGESGAPLFECETTDDCGSFEECIEGMCQALPDKLEGSCEQDSECAAEQICVSGTCEDKGDYCKLDSDCGQFETCEFNLPDEPGGQPSEWGDCAIDEDKIPIDSTCASVCQTLSNCPNVIEGESSEGSGGGSGSSAGSSDQKADEASDKAEFVQECTLSCSYFVATNQAVAEFQAAATCVQQNAASCEAIETNCLDEIEAVDTRIDELDDDKAAGGGEEAGGTNNGGTQGNGVGGTGTGDDERGGCAVGGVRNTMLPGVLVAVFGLLVVRRRRAGRSLV